MLIRKTKEFENGFKKLNPEIKKLLLKQEAIFVKNWLDPRLHTKRIKEITGVYSFRITRRYRALFYFRKEEAVFFAIGHRKDIYEDV